MDSDVIIFDDPYKYLKAPPFRDFTVLDQPEVCQQALGKNAAVW
jgi:hypothetical protein